MTFNVQSDPYGLANIEIINCAGVNSFYGHSSIIRRYSGYPIDKPIPYIVQHGSIGLSQDYYEIREWYERERVSCYWAWSSSIIEHAQACNTNFRIDILGSPFLYFVKLYRQAKKQYKHSGKIPSNLRLDDIENLIIDLLHFERVESPMFPNIIFAPHSLPNRKIPAAEHREFARYLMEEKQLFDAKVCLHPYDIFLGNHIVYQDSGFTVDCCMVGAINGYPWIESDFWHEYKKVGIEFIANIYKLLSVASRCYFCGLSTPLFYAGYLRKQCTLLSASSMLPCYQMPQVKALALKRIVSRLDLSSCPNLDILLDLENWDNACFSQFKSYSDLVLGRYHLLSKRELRNRLNAAELLVRNA
jgi:hypothetical protein